VIARFTPPLPIPETPVETVIHVACEALVHAHVVPADTVTVIVPPAAETAWLAGTIVNVQGAVAACDTVTT
jgi:hypothetical protein